MQGNLYLNTLNYFWDEYESAQEELLKQEYIKEHPGCDVNSVVVGLQKKLDQYTADIFEGASVTVNPSRSGFPKDFVDATMFDNIFRIYGYRYANVLCMSRIDFCRDKKMDNQGGVFYAIAEKMDSFGKYVVVIDDENEFYNRLKIKMEAEHFKFLYGDVEYKNFPPFENQTVLRNCAFLKAEGTFDFGKVCHTEHLTSVRDVFVKSMQYAYQRERRLVLYRGVKETKAYILQVGKLDDIAHIADVDELGGYITLRYRWGFIKSFTEGCCGNLKSRGQLKDLFLKLGCNKVEMLSIMG